MTFNSRGRCVAGDFEPSECEVHSRQHVLNELLAIIKTTYRGVCVCVCVLTSRLSFAAEYVEILAL